MGPQQTPSLIMLRSLVQNCNKSQMSPHGCDVLAPMMFCKKALYCICFVLMALIQQRPISRYQTGTSRGLFDLDTEWPATQSQTQSSRLSHWCRKCLLSSWALRTFSRCKSSCSKATRLLCVSNSAKANSSLVANLLRCLRWLLN